MAERPILFSGEMVRAILEGRKTQTRRVIDCGCNSRHMGRLLGEWGLSSPPHKWDGERKLWMWTGRQQPKAGDWIEEVQIEVDDYATQPVRCPYGVPGDTLWVRETWAPFGDQAAIYCATNIGLPVDRWRPSIHMPRWASRITLRVTGVRVERLQEISEEDTQAEGITEADIQAVSERNRELPGAILAFRYRWSTIHAADGPYGWTANPWVWVVEFEKEAHHA